MNFSKKINIQDNDLVLFGITSLVVFISRLPFIFHGYGTDPDAWGVAFAARMISLQGGEYYISRFPGYPVQEYSYSFLWQGGPALMNGVTALLSGAAAAFLVLSVKNLGGQLPFLTGVAFACIPVVYVNSVNSMDYMWAICFILGSLYFLLSDRVVISGLFLGLAMGTRITSGAMFLPLSVLWFVRKGEKLALVKFATTAVIVGGICFLPVFLKFGIRFLKFTELQKIPLKTIVKLATIDAWGLVGIFVLTVVSVYCLLYVFLKSQRGKGIPSYWRVWVLVICLYTVVYLRLPHESGYLIPTLPFLFLLLNGLMDRKALLVFCMGIIISPFFFSISLGESNFKNKLLNYTIDVKFSRWHVYVHPFIGPIIEDQLYRFQEMERFQNILQFGNTLRNKSLIIVGWNMAKFVVLTTTPKDQNSGRVIFSDFLTKDEIQYFINEEYQIYFLPEMSDTGRDVFGVDFQQMGAIPLDDSVFVQSK